MSKKRIMLITFIFLLLCFSTLFIYYVFVDYDDSVDKGYVTLTNSNSVVEITSPLSLNDETGKNIKSNKDGVDIYYKVKLKNTHNRKSRYKLLLDVRNLSNSIDNEYMKVLLSNKKDEIIRFYDRESYPNLNLLPLFNGKYVLYSGSLKANAEETFILRIWVGDFYVMDKVDQVFKADIDVYSY